MRIKKKHLLLYCAFTVWVLAAAGCGYQFAGMQRSPFDIRHISVLMFDNKTSEIGVESVLANDLIAEVTRDGRMILAETDRADAVFSGVVRSMDISTISREKGYAAAERRVNITVDVRLTDNDQNLLWSRMGIGAWETYLVAEDKLATEYNQKIAIAEVSRKIVQDIYQQLNQSF